MLKNVYFTPAHSQRAKTRFSPDSDAAGEKKPEA